jgi:hypothetical protein
MDHASANDFVLFGFLNTISLVILFVVFFLGNFLWCSGDSYILKHRAKVMPPQAASVSLGVFVVLTEGRKEILGNYIESCREKCFFTVLI